MTNLQSIVSLLFSHFCIHFIFSALSKLFFYCTCVYVYMPDDIVVSLLQFVQFVYNKKIGLAMRIKNYAKFYAWPYNVINVRSTRPKRTVVATELLWEISTE